MSTIRVIMLPVGEPARVAEIPSTLDGMQVIVDGLIDVMALPAGVDVVFNDEGRLRYEIDDMTMAPNRSFLMPWGWCPILGPCFLARHDDAGDFVSLTPYEAARLLVYANSPGMVRTLPPIGHYPPEIRVISFDDL